MTSDEDRAYADGEYHRGAQSFHAALRSFGYKVIVKKVRWFDNADGTRYGKANADLDLAVDALLQSDNLDRVVLGDGDGDFVRVVQALQNKGCRVEAVGFNHVSLALKEEVDLFMSGHLVPGLAGKVEGPAWGEVGSTVRGYCYYYNNERGFGYLRFQTGLTGAFSRNGNGGHEAYETAFSHFSQPEDTSLQNKLPDHNLVFVFRLGESGRQMGGLTAGRIVCVGA